MLSALEAAHAAALANARPALRVDLKLDEESFMPATVAVGQRVLILSGGYESFSRTS
jgi:hypothetical protein